MQCHPKIVEHEVLCPVNHLLWHGGEGSRDHKFGELLRDMVCHSHPPLLKMQYKQSLRHHRPTGKGCGGHCSTWTMPQCPPQPLPVGRWWRRDCLYCIFSRDRKSTRLN